MSQPARLIAAKILEQVLGQHGSLSTQISKQIGEVDYDEQGLTKELCFGVCRYYPQLNSVALSLLSKPFEEKDLDLYATLLMGLYQIEHMNTPDHAAVNESVELCRQLDKDWATKLMNAVLRRYQRERDDILDNLASQPSVEFNLPKWLVKRFKKHWGDDFEQVVTATNTHPPMCIRVNQDKVSRETYQAQLTEQGTVSRETAFSDSGLYLEKAVSVTMLPDFEHGHASVQDESAQLAAMILAPEQGERVLDACAAPGGKTGHLLERAPELQLTAVELEPWRLQRIESNLERLGVQAELICADAGDTNAWWDQQAFDKILLDAPCSATGVIRRNPDIKINRKPADIDELVTIQQRILMATWQTLKPGGYLLYATCSLMPEENERQMAHFLAEQADAKECSLDTLNSALALGFGKAVSHGIQVLPTVDGQDGFYYCLLQKQA
ncbi:16S rRNA (cytosine(967)-C(5))-methyltransferase RsmB [Marinomonas ostreistagni]|uniref:16S rRNA (cytosine(967)-C(5))-methyltransferase RsmB n=1 Tax=Marinomonas ostreistagni TaxID=359209 RepID=UPI00194DF82D|nr:16S rRNA (cytosine(967)-C(5))-methyltransferase RsmB [Marinomonas ostreistagni]MBM6550670.1 16S rRNA (cytosine(967)-C(5))-methyltransferase RsmB [Marinomonas ostreistagni]